MSSFKDAATAWKDIYLFMFDEKDGTMKGIIKDEDNRCKVATSIFIDLGKHPSVGATGTISNAPAKPTWTECPKCHSPTKSGIGVKTGKPWCKCEKCNSWISEDGKLKPIIPREF
jgi:hypothetical protein